MPIEWLSAKSNTINGRGPLVGDELAGFGAVVESGPARRESTSVTWTVLWPPRPRAKLFALGRGSLQARWWVPSNQPADREYVVSRLEIRLVWIRAQACEPKQIRKQKKI